jgi:DNA topoisomerase-6 subunit B
MQERRRKRDKLATILPDMARKVSEVTEREPLDIDDSLARIMNNVLIERRRENGTVQLVVENNSSTNADLDVTEIVSAEPSGANGASVVEMDGEWFLQWEPTVESGGEAVLEYEVGEDADFDVSVEGIESAKLTIDA